MDVVTGAKAEVDLVVDLPLDAVWDLITDVDRTGGWSPECVHAAWLPGHAGDPRKGDRFEARNRYADGFEAAVSCLVTEAERLAVFEWVVLDDSAVPGSIWRYELCSVDGGTRVRQSFTHGAGVTGLRVGVLNQPDRADEVLADRLAELRTNMTRTMAAMFGMMTVVTAR